MDFEEILRHFDHVSKAGSQWRADCPACGDKKQHLYINRVPDGKILLDCKKGCLFPDIIAAAGLKQSDCFGENPVKSTRWQILREHFYTDANGNIIAKKQICDTGDGKKTGIWYRLEKGQYIKGLDGKKMPLYHLDRLLKAKETVVVAEGEKDVETLERMGFIATTSPNGAGSKWRSDFNEFFRGKNVVVITDNDEPGEKYGSDAAGSIMKTAAAVKLVPASAIYPGLKPKGDISDIAAEVGDAEAKNLLWKAVEKTAPIAAPAKAAKQLVFNDVTLDSSLRDKIRELHPEARFSQNDRGNGELFAAVFGETARYNVTAKEWYIYRDGYWQPDTGAMVVSGYAKDLYDTLLLYASALPDGSKTNYIDHVNKMGRLSVRENMIKDARDRTFIKSDELDRDPWLFNCINGTYDLRQGYFRKHLPGDLISKMSNVYYDEAARSADFEKFLREVMCSDGEKTRYLMKALGYSLTGDTSEECMFILYGRTTRNGKGTLMETIGYLMGGEAGYAMTSNPETLARKQNKDSRQASGDIARLKGVRFLNVSEPDKGMVLDTALIKTLTGRDTITARHLHEREFQFVPNLKLFINTNYLPHVNDDTVFSSERINVITFDRHFTDEEQDRGLKDKLRTRENISGIFNMLLQGLKDYKRERLRRPRSVSEATAEYRRSSDRTGLFLSECLEADAFSSVTAKAVYDLYLAWCRSNNYRAENKGNFMAGLRAKNMLTDFKKIDGQSCRNVINGYRIADGYDSNDTLEQFENPPL